MKKLLDYIWIIILGILGLISLLIFLLSLSKDSFLTNKLKRKKTLALNFSLLAISLGNLSVIIYLFILLKNQIELMNI